MSSTAELHIRRFQPADFSGLVAARRSAIRDVASQDYTPAQIQAWEDDHDDPEARVQRFVQSLTWVAEQDGHVVGFINLAAAGYLDCLYVHGAYQRRGVATALFRALEAAAVLRGDQRLYSQVSLTARGFFERQGFAVITPETVHSRGQDYRVFQMEKPLH